MSHPTNKPKTLLEQRRARRETVRLGLAEKLAERRAVGADRLTARRKAGADRLAARKQGGLDRLAERRKAGADRLARKSLITPAKPKRVAVRQKPVTATKPPSISARTVAARKLTKRAPSISARTVNRMAKR